MSHINYTLEVIGCLLKRSKHIRALAHDLNTNQTTIARKMKELEAYNVVNYRTEGKNKVYFLKKTLEAQQYVYLTEHYKLLKLVEKYPLLKPIIQKIHENKDIQLSLLFGSYAKNRAHKRSDIDVYIETSRKEIKKVVEHIHSRLSVKIGRYNKDTTLFQEIEKDHIIIKGVETYYERLKR